MPRLIAFTGVAGSGKSTAAQYLVFNHGFRRLSFAGPLKDMMRALGLSEEQINGALKETPCDLLCGKTPRYAMQTIGTEWGRNLIGDGIWVSALLHQFHSSEQPAVIDDCRFPNEANAILDVGGKIIRIDRPGAGSKVGAAHASEALIKHLPFTGILVNDETVDNLYLTLDSLLAPA